MNLSCNLNICYCLYNSPSCVSDRSQINPVQEPPSPRNPALPYKPRSPKWPLSLRLPPKPCLHLSSTPLCTICHAHLNKIIMNDIWREVHIMQLIIIQFPQSPCYLILLTPNILLSTLFLNILNPCSLLPHQCHIPSFTSIYLYRQVNLSNIIFC
jgi:hypothetical protein